MDRVQRDVDSIADLFMACRAAGKAGRRQIGVDGQNGKFEEQLVLLTAMVVGGNSPAMAMAVVMVRQMRLEFVSSA